MDACDYFDFCFCFCFGCLPSYSFWVSSLNCQINLNSARLQRDAALRLYWKVLKRYGLTFIKNFLKDNLSSYSFWLSAHSSSNQDLKNKQMKDKGEFYFVKTVRSSFVLCLSQLLLPFDARKRYFLIIN